jgi:hypothetical protein
MSRDRFISARAARLAVAWALLGLAAVPVSLMAVEWVAYYYVTSRYAIEEIGGPRMKKVGAHVVTLSDEVLSAPDSDGVALGIIRIALDGRDLSADPTKREIDVRADDTGRYGRGVGLRWVTDRLNGTRYLAIAENLSRPSEDGSVALRILSVYPTGRTIDDRFSLNERRYSPLRTALVRGTVPHPIGYLTDVLEGGPDPIVPLVTPLMSGIAGLLLLRAGWKNPA